jgi:hypothetical protein
LRSWRVNGWHRRHRGLRDAAAARFVSPPARHANRSHRSTSFRGQGKRASTTRAALADPAVRPGPRSQRSNRRARCRCDPRSRRRRRELQLADGGDGRLIRYRSPERTCRYQSSEPTNAKDRERDQATMHHPPRPAAGSSEDADSAARTEAA